MATATMTSKGQVTIPKQVREQLHLHAGDRIEFLVHGDSEARLKPITQTVNEVFGCLYNPDQKTVSVEQINEAVAQGFRKQNR